MNSFCAVGKLTRNPTVRCEGEGVQSATATLAIVESGRLKPFTLYVPLTFWGKAGEQASTLGAQDMIAITGKLCWRKLHSKDGQDKSSLAVEVKTVEVLQPAAVEGPA